jgi:hypothetical protein
MEISEIKNWALIFATGFKSHYCSLQMITGFISDYQSRVTDGDVYEIRDVEKGGIDLPGMIMSDRPVEHIEIDENFTLSIPSQDFEHFYNELAMGKSRKFQTGQEYFKIHGWLSCVIFSSEQREKVLKKMSEMLSDIKKRADEADEEFSRRLKRCNEKSKVKYTSHRDKANPRMTIVPSQDGEKN